MMIQIHNKRYTKIKFFKKLYFLVKEKTKLKVSFPFFKSDALVKNFKYTYICT